MNVRALKRCWAECYSSSLHLDRLNAAGYRPAITYQPAQRFWLFRAHETAIFAARSLLLIGFCFLRIRRD